MILADEPTKGLDEERIEMVVDAFHSLKDQAVLCVTHDLNFAREISDSISVMYASNQVEYASAKELLEHPLHPYTQDMIAAMPENGPSFFRGLCHGPRGLRRGRLQICAPLPVLQGKMQGDASDAGGGGPSGTLLALYGKGGRVSCF